MIVKYLNERTVSFDCKTFKSRRNQRAPHIPIVVVVVVGFSCSLWLSFVLASGSSMVVLVGMTELMWCVFPWSHTVLLVRVVFGWFGCEFLISMDMCMSVMSFV